MKVLGAGDEALDFYRVISLAGPGHGEILACAARQSGFAAMSLSAGGPGHFGKKLTPEGVDFVDVAPLGIDGHPFAVAALGGDCSIHFARDLSSAMDAETLRFGGLNEQAYRILCAEGHMILLTDKTLYAFIDLASRFLAGEATDGPATARGFRLDAVDASLAPDGSLLVVMTDSVYRIRIASLVADTDDVGSIRDSAHLRKATGTRKCVRWTSGIRLGGHRTAPHGSRPERSGIWPRSLEQASSEGVVTPIDLRPRARR